MKALAILFRLVFSILVLLAIACYLQVSPTISLGQFCSGINTTALLDQLCGVNYLTISLAIVVVLTILSFTRLLEALWNMLFGASVVLLLGVGLYSICGPGIALPNALYHNELINDFCSSATGYEVPIAITMLIFIAGWVCASASGRVAITAAISFGLWYGITEFFTYATHLWARSAEPALPEALYMVQGSPWILAAVPGAFFLIYALLMAFFETYISSGRRKPAEKPTEKPEESKADTPSAPVENKEKKTDEPSPAAATAATAQPVLKPAEPASKTKPVLKTAAPAPARTLKLATPAMDKQSAPVAEKAGEQEKAPETPDKQPAEAKIADAPPATADISSPEKPETEEKSAQTSETEEDKQKEENKAAEVVVEDSAKDETKA